MGVVSTFIQFYVISLLYQSIFSNKNALWDLNCSKHRVWMVEGYCECFMKIDPVLLVFVVVFARFCRCYFIHFHIDLLISHYQKNTGCKFHEKQVICPAGKSLNIIANKGLFQGFFSECEQICRYLYIGFHLLKK